jgi:oligopeptide transport system substrate-binding protein
VKALLLALMLVAASAVQAGTVLNRGNGAEPESLDPAFAGGAAEINILGDMMVGLTTLDAAARPVPGIAERWETSKDGLSWTFHLRDARWSDGAPVTARDFVFAWRRLLDPRTASRTANILWVVKNARNVSSGTLPGTALGVAAKDPRTLAVMLEYPAPYLPELLAHPAALPRPQQNSTAIFDGPYLLKSWGPGDHVALVKNPRFYDAAKVRIDAVNYWPTADTQAALRRLRAGELDMQTPLPSAGLDWMRANMPGALHIVPSLALAYVVFNLRDPALKDGRVRRALNLVYDRDAVAHKVMKLGETPAYSLVPPATANYRGGPRFDFAALPYPARLAMARKLMQEAGYGPFNRLRLDYAVSANPDSRRLAAVFQAMARQVYVDVQIRVADYQITLRNMRQGQFQLAYTTWLADFDDAANFLDLLRSGNPNNYAGYRNPKFDAAMVAAEREADPAKRARLMQGAEKMALADNAWLAIRFLNQSEAVGPRIGGYVPNARQYNRSRWLWIK